MAQTKIWTRKCPVTKSVNYVLNPQKTKDEEIHQEENRLLNNELKYVTEKQIIDDGVDDVYLTAAWNCTEKNASEKFMRTKELWGKGNDEEQGLVLLYHMEQSFKPGEITPDLAYKIGCAFAERVFSDRYEVVMGTHIDKVHIHNHFLINAVSFLDGTRLRNESSGIKAFYFENIRKVSDELCREYNLSVIGETAPRKYYRDKSGHYSVWNETSRPTKRDAIKQDIDDAISKSQTFLAFLSKLKEMGYQIKIDNVKHMAIKKEGTDRFVRIRSLGHGYDEQMLRDRIDYPELFTSLPPHKDEQSYWTNRRPATFYFGKKSTHLSYSQMKRSGLVKTYYQYLYVIGRTAKRSSQNTAMKRQDLMRFRRMTDQFKYMLAHKIEYRADVDARLSDLTQKLNGAVFVRNQVYAEQKRETNQNPNSQEQLTIRKEETNKYIRQLRYEIKICNDIGGYENEVQRSTNDYKAQNRNKENDKEKVRDLL